MEKKGTISDYWKNSIYQFATFLRLERSLSPNTISAYCSDVTDFFEYLAAKSSTVPSSASQTAVSSVASQTSVPSDNDQVAVSVDNNPANVYIMPDSISSELLQEYILHRYKRGFTYIFD